MYADRVACCPLVNHSMPTGQSDRRTDARTLHYAFRYGRCQDRLTDHATHDASSNDDRSINVRRLSSWTDIVCNAAGTFDGVIISWLVIEKSCWRWPRMTALSAGLLIYSFRICNAAGRRTQMSADNWKSCCSSDWRYQSINYGQSPQGRTWLRAYSVLVPHQSINSSRSVLSGVPRRHGIRCPQAGSRRLSTHVTVAALRCCTGRIGTCQSRRYRSITAQWA